MSDRRRFGRAGAMGGAVAALVFGWMLTGGTGRLLAWHPASDFYDAQAHQLLHGHLDVPRSVLGIEAFASHGRTYMYQGPFPALLRFPIAALTHRFDGRLSGLSMLVAFAVVVVATVWMAWRVRGVVRGDAPVSRVEELGLGLFVFACAGGSAIAGVGSQVSVYHESAMWGLATGMVTISLLVEHLTARRRWTLAAASVAATACLFSRASIGLGVTVGLGVVTLLELHSWWRERGRVTRPLVAGVATVLPVALYVLLNLAKFGTMASVPWEHQAFIDVSEDRRTFLAAHDGTFFGLDFIPSTAVAYLRPDAARLDRRYPWVRFRTDDVGKRHIVGTTVIDRIDASGSIPVGYPVPLALSVVGLVAVVRRRLRALWPAVAGAAAAAATIFVFGYIAERYLADAFPLVAVLGAVGLFVLVDRPRRVSMAVLGVVVVLATWVNVGQGIWYQGVYASPADEAATGAFFDKRVDWPALGGAIGVGRGDALPVRGAPGDVFVVGDCDGAYVSDGGRTDALSHTNWKAITRTPRVGAHDLDVRFGDLRAGEAIPLLSTAGSALLVEATDRRHVRFRFRGAGFGDGEPFSFDPDRTYHVRASLDPNTDFGLAVVDGRTRFSGGYTDPAVPTLEHRLDVRERPVSRATCRKLVADSAAARRGTGRRTATA